MNKQIMNLGYVHSKLCVLCVLLLYACILQLKIVLTLLAGKK